MWKNAQTVISTDEMAISMVSINKVAYHFFADSDWQHAYKLAKFTDLPEPFMSCGSIVSSKEWEELLTRILSYYPYFWQTSALDILRETVKRLWHLFTEILNSEYANNDYLHYIVDRFNNHFESSGLPCILKLSGAKVKYKAQGRYNVVKYKKATRSQVQRDQERSLGKFTSKS